MRRLPPSLTLLALAALSRADWDVRNDFSLASNPNGAWSYGAVVESGSFLPLAQAQSNYLGFESWLDDFGTGVNSVGINATTADLFGVPAGEFALNSSRLYRATARWKAPTPGDFRISGLFGRGFGSFTVTQIRMNGIAVNETFTVSAFDFERTLDAGDTIDFLLITGEYTPLSAHIAPVPEPASLFALGLGALALLRRRRR